VQYKDYYQTLGVAKDASASDIQKAYRSLARKYHPDVNKDAQAEDRFKEIGEAYEVLKDADKRQKYDRYGSAWQTAQQTGAPPPGWEGFDFGGDGASYRFEGGGGDGFSSFFEMLFGGGDPFGGGGRGGRGGRQPRGRQVFWESQQPQRGPQPPSHRETTIRLPLEDLARGGKRKIELLDPETGSTRTLEVNLPVGLLPGKKIRLTGQGGRNRDGSKGDLFLVIEASKHPWFRLDKRNLEVDVPIAPWTAALGGQVKVPTLDGEVTIKVSAGTSSGRKVRLRGKGMPDKKDPGDLIAILQIVVPEKLSEREKELFELLAEESEFEPKPATT
jgi:curved DNA-binding protein